METPLIIILQKQSFEQKMLDTREQYGSYRMFIIPNTPTKRAKRNVMVNNVRLVREKK